MKQTDRSYFLKILLLTVFFMAAAAVSSRPMGLRLLDEKSGFFGDIKSRDFKAAADAGVPDHPTAWLPTLRVARAWQALVRDQPFN
jgi:hypothetical protein